MDLNFPPPDTNSEGNTPLHSMVRTVHPPMNHEFVGEQPNVNQIIPGRMPEWLVQFTTVSNPCRALEQFQKLNSPAFKGGADTIQEEEWLRQIEKILEVMECTENQQVSFASFIF